MKFEEGDPFLFAPVVQRRGPKSSKLKIGVRFTSGVLVLVDYVADDVEILLRAFLSEMLLRGSINQTKRDALFCAYCEFAIVIVLNGGQLL